MRTIPIKLPRILPFEIAVICINTNPDIFNVCLNTLAYLHYNTKVLSQHLPILATHSVYIRFVNGVVRELHRH